MNNPMNAVFLAIITGILLAYVFGMGMTDAERKQPCEEYKLFRIQNVPARCLGYFINSKDN